MNSHQRRVQRRAIAASGDQTQLKKETVQDMKKAVPTDKRKESAWPRWRSRLETVGTLLAVLTALFSFFPHLTISDPTTLDETKFFSKAFTLTNDGILPVFGVKCGVALVSITRADNVIIRSENPFGAEFLPPDCHASIMEPGDSFTFSTESTLITDTTNIKAAEFGIVVSYIPFLPPVRMQHCLHFRTYTDKSGKQHWFRSPGQCVRFRWLHSYLS